MSQMDGFWSCFDLRPRQRPLPHPPVLEASATAATSLVNTGDSGRVLDFSHAIHIGLPLRG